MVLTLVFGSQLIFPKQFDEVYLLRVPSNVNKGFGERASIYFCLVGWGGLVEARFVCISTMLSSWVLNYIMKGSESTKFVGV